MQTVVVATHNAHKVAEIRAILGTPEWQLIALEEAGVLDAAVEDAHSFTENALIKARFAHQRTGLSALADDSGLVVDALDGAPGIYSSRYAGETASDEENLKKLLAEMAGLPLAQRTARFVCVVAYLDASGNEAVATGTLEGRIALAPSGQAGFGYDPVFIPADSSDDRTLAEYSAVEKNALSHRFCALRALAKTLGLGDVAEGAAFTPLDSAASFGTPLDSTTISPVNTLPGVVASTAPVLSTTAPETAPKTAQVLPVKQPVRIAAFDFDGTLIDAASPVRLVLRLTKDRIMSVRASVRVGAWGVHYKMGSEMDQSLPRGYVFRSLKHVSASDADAIMSNLYHEELRRFLRPQALAEVARLQEQGVLILIISASFEPIVREAAREISADGFIATRMEIKDGCYTGKTVGEPPEGKQKLVQLRAYADEHYGADNWVFDWAYGDHFSDVPLMEQATHAVAVDPDRRLERIAKSRGWVINEWKP